jgi:hypothetical protein
LTGEAQTFTPDPLPAAGLQTTPQPTLTDVVLSPLIVEEDGTEPLVFNFTLDKVGGVRLGWR